MDKDIFKNFASPSTKETHLALSGDFFRKYVGVALWRVSDWYDAKSIDNGEIELLRKPAVIISDEEEGRKAM